jgi:uncharacterized protein (TIGR00369 family)
MDADAAWVPYYDLLGIEITAVDGGHARGRLALTEELSAAPGTEIAHGGAIASLADSVGYWAVSSANDGALTPTVDLRLDYLSPGTDDLLAEAEVTRNGESVGTVDVLVERAGDGETVALGRGTFKTGGGGGETAWQDGE